MRHIRVTPWGEVIRPVGYRRDGSPIWPIRGAMDAFGITARAFRFYEDGTETGATAIAAENANITRDVETGNSVVHLRYGVQESGSGSIGGATTDDYQLQYSKNGGAYADVTGASTNVRGFTSSSVTDAAATTQRLSAGTGSFIAGEISETDGLLTDWQLTADNHSELLYIIELVSADLAHNDTLDFRVLLNGAVFNTYSVTPRITASKFTQNLNHPLKKLALDLGATFGVFMDAASGNLTDFIAGKTCTANGTLTYGVAAKAPNGRTAIDLDGTTGWFSIADHADLDLGDGPFTLEAWFRVDGGSGVRQILARGNSNGYQMAVDSTGVITLFAAGSGAAVSSTTTVTDGGWHHVAVTWGGTSGNVYIDGIDQSGASTDRAFADGTDTIGIGRHGVSAQEFFNGPIAYAATYKSVLTQAQVQSLYDASLRSSLRPRLLPQLLAH